MGRLPPTRSAQCEESARGTVKQRALICASDARQEAAQVRLHDRVRIVGTADDLPGRKDVCEVLEVAAVVHEAVVEEARRVHVRRFRQCTIEAVGYAPTLRQAMYERNNGAA